MQEIIELAVDKGIRKQMRRLDSYDILPNVSDFEKERKGFLSAVNKPGDEIDGIKNEIMRHGYWEIRLIPEEYPQKLFSFEKLRDVLETCQVRYRGWYYPHISYGNRSGKYYNADNYVQSWVRYMYFAEIFRFYTSGQFVHYTGMYEDRKNDDDVTSLTRRNSGIKTSESEQSFLEPVGSLFLLTEIFLFAAKLAKKGIFGKRIHITIKLHNQKDRVLRPEDPTQISWWNGRSYTDVIDLMNSSMDIQRLCLDYDKMAVDKTIYLLELFNCSSKDLRTLLENDQKRMYGRTF